MRASLSDRLRLFALAVCLLGGQCALAHDPQNEPESPTLEKVSEYLKRNQWGIAKEILQKEIDKTPPRADRSTLIGELGLLHLQSGETDVGEKNLIEAIASGQGDSQQNFRWHLALLALWNHSSPPNARFDSFFKVAEGLAAGYPARQLKLNLLKLDREARVHPQAAEESAEKLLEDILKLPAGEARAVSLISLASILETAERGSAEPLKSLTQVRFSALNQTIEDAKTFPDLESLAYLKLVELYREKQRDADALHIAEQAILLSEKETNATSRWQLLAQKAQLERAQGHIEAALRDYSEAFERAESLRKDFPKWDDQGQSWFSSHVSPIYLERVSLLVDRVANLNNETVRRDFLMEAIFTLESINRSALEEFLGHACGVPDRKSNSSDLLLKGEKGVAFLYPLVNKDRVMILLAAGGGIQAFPIRGPSAPSIIQKMHTLARMLSNPSSNPEPLAKELFTILLAPLSEDLKRNKTETLVIIPDRHFRKIPFAALHDGEAYIGTRYNFSTLTGITLFNPLEEESSTGEKILLAGVSSPGPVVDQLPETIKKEVMFSAKARSRALASPLSGHENNHDIMTHALALPGVQKEIESLEPMSEMTMLNQGFTLEALRASLREHNYSALHIASHGLIGKRADASYILAYDDLIRFEALDTYLQAGGRSGKKLGLLTLSACHTAEGDDQAPLGLSGLALRAGIPRAMGSLWPVDDTATVDLMRTFYRELIHQGTSASKALRVAQQEVSKDPRFKHPYYWAPFILVGQWW